MNVQWIRPFDTISQTDLPEVGGKGANLGEMTRAGWPVPPGFCVTTAAFRQFMADSGVAADLYADLAALAAADVAAAREVGGRWRARLVQAPLPLAVVEGVTTAWQSLGTDHAYAVRSSATAEDLPDASFAGQQDTFLNVRGLDDLLARVRDCWVSLFTDRAILYRARNGFDHQEVALSVVVQQMVIPDAAGILFTADPVSGSRAKIVIDASFGLGEALVAGLVTPDLYTVDKRRPDQPTIQVAAKQLAIRAHPDGGTFQEALSGADREKQVLTTAQIQTLAALGLEVEAHYGQPQDIEWALVGDRFFLLQTRPITSLYPLPSPMPADDSLHIYVSVSHAQVMTDPMQPLGASALRLILPFGSPPGPAPFNPNVVAAGGRVYADVTPLLRHPVGARVLKGFIQFADPLMGQAITKVMDSPDFLRDADQAATATSRGLARWLLPLLLQMPLRLFWYRPENSIDFLEQFIAAAIAKARARLAAAPAGAPRLAVAAELLHSFFLQAGILLPPFIGGGVASQRLLTHLLGDRADPADMTALGRGLHGNVTTEMDMMVGDLADVARREPALVARLRTSADADAALATLADVPGGAAFLAAWQTFLARYGMRGPSEIDISRPRWADAPDSLLQMVVGNLAQPEAGVHRRYHAQLAAAGEAAGERLVAAARFGLLGPLRARLVRRMVRVTRFLLPTREHPKYMMMQLMGLARQVIMDNANDLAAAGRLLDADDVWLLTWEELATALADEQMPLTRLIETRRALHTRYHELTPPRVMTDDGEIPTVSYDATDHPAGALAGNPVSAGVIEGIARVVLDPTHTLLKPGEILVAPFTDPGWTPLFINAAGLVMEVGGLMTHGSVIAREYGIPAVVGVIDATKKIETGQRLRVHGDGGYVEILAPAPES